jgi:hypothetical protein
VQVVGLVAAIVGVIGLAVGAVALISSSSTRSDADAAAAEADEVEQQVTDAEARQEEAAQALERLATATDEVLAAARAFEAAIDDGVQTYNVLDPLYVQAVELINAGNVQAGQQLMRQEGQQATQAFQQAVAAELETQAQLQTAVNEYEEAVGDE